MHSKVYKLTNTNPQGVGPCNYGEKLVPWTGGGSGCLCMGKTSLGIPPQLETPEVHGNSPWRSFYVGFMDMMSLINLDLLVVYS